MIKNKIKFARTAIVSGSKARLFSLGISREANDHVVVVAPVSGGGEAGLSGQAGNRLGSGLGSTPDQNLHNVSVLLRIESRKLWKKMLWFSLKEYSTKLKLIYHGILLNYNDIIFSAVKKQLLLKIITWVCSIYTELVIKSYS